MGENIKRIPLLLFIIILLIINFTISSVSAAPATTLVVTSNNTTDFGEITTTNPTFNRTITVTYTHSGIFRPQGSLLPILFPNQRTPTPIALSVETYPNWCTVTFSETNFSMPIGRFLRSEEITKSTTMIVTTNISNVKAKTNGKITIQVNAAENGKLPSASATLDFTIAVGFISSLNVEIAEDIITPLSSNDWGNLTLRFNNTSNEKIQVLINYTKIPDTHTPDIQLPTGFTMDQNTKKTEIIPFKVKALNVTVNKTQKLELQITYSMASDATETGGDPIIIKTTRTIQYDPSQEDVLDLAPAFIGVAVFFLLVIAFFSFIVMRRR